MENITTVEELKAAIYKLEQEKAIKWELLREEFYLTYENLKPFNLIKNGLKEMTTSPQFLESIISTTLGLFTGNLSRKLVMGGSRSIIRNLLGSILQFGITREVANHPDAIKSFGRFIFQNLLQRKKNSNQYNGFDETIN